MRSTQIIWRGSPSQWVNAKAFSGAFMFFLMFLALHSSGAIDAMFSAVPALDSLRGLGKTFLCLCPLLFAGVRWLQVKYHVYELTEEVLREHSGVLNRVSQELELYRVNDTMVLQPFELNMMGLGNVVLHTSDASSPVVVISAVPQPQALREEIREYVETQRNRKGIVEMGNR